MFKACLTNSALILALILIYKTVTTGGLGINCQGSGVCHLLKGGEAIPYMQNTSDAIHDNDIWLAGSHIFAIKTSGWFGHSSLCLFYQSDNVDNMNYIAVVNVAYAAVPGSLVKQKLLQMYDHECKMCGSVPLSDDNDPVKLGELTANWVHDAHDCGRQGLCSADFRFDDPNNPLYSQVVSFDAQAAATEAAAASRATNAPPLAVNSSAAQT